MKCVLLFVAVIAVWISGSESAKKTCEDLATCGGDMTRFSNMDQSKIKEACASMREVFTCFREAMDDCKSKSGGNNQQFEAMESQVDGVEKMINQHCGGACAITMSITLMMFALLSIFF